MKITREYLKRVIKEELEKVVGEAEQPALQPSAAGLDLAQDIKNIPYEERLRYLHNQKVTPAAYGNNPNSEGFQNAVKIFQLAGGRPNQKNGQMELDASAIGGQVQQNVQKIVDAIGVNDQLNNYRVPEKDRITAMALVITHGYEKAEPLWKAIRAKYQRMY